MMRKGKAYREIRRQQAEERAEQRQKRSAQDQIDLLDAKFGPGVGAARERARLARTIESASKGAAKKSTSKDKPKTRASRRAARNKRKLEQNS